MTAMKFELLLHSDDGDDRHDLELDSPKEWPASGGRVQFSLDGQSGEADWAELEPGKYSLLIDGRSYPARVHAARGEGGVAGAYELSVAGRNYRVEITNPRRRRRSSAETGQHGPQEILAPMPGKIVRLLVSENQEVRPHQGLLVMEAMKMQNELKAQRSGRVEKIHVSEGAGVETGAKLLRLS